MSGNQRSLPTKERKQMLSLWTGTTPSWCNLPTQKLNLQILSRSWSHCLRLQKISKPTQYQTIDIQPTTLHKTTTKNQNTQNTVLQHTTPAMTQTQINSTFKYLVSSIRAQANLPCPLYIQHSTLHLHTPKYINVQSNQKITAYSSVQSQRIKVHNQLRQWDVGCKSQYPKAFQLPHSNSTHTR